MAERFKRMIKIAALILAAVLALTPVPVFASQNDPAIKATAKSIDQIWDARMKAEGAASLQELVWKYADSAGSGEEWYILSLRQRFAGSLDFSEYRKAYEEYLQKKDLINATAKLKAALTLQAVGSSSDYIDKAADEAIGKLGIMSYIYGLHILTNGARCSVYTKDQVIDTLLGLQLEDGGWAVMGDGGDVDVTAMAVQALAPYRDTNARVLEATDRAVDLLSLRQRDNGTFVSFGSANAESTAQVLLALACVGIDQEKDSRFIKNGLTVTDILDSFKLADGVYAHSYGEGENASAIIQTLYALTGYEMMQKGTGSLYVFGAYSEPSVPRPAARNIKPLLYAGIAAAAVIAGAVLLILKKRSYKSYLFVVIVAVIAAAGVRFINIAKPSDYYGKDDTVITDPVKTVISIRCDTVAGKKDHIPKDGIILDRFEVTVNKGQNAYDQLVSAAKQKSIHIDVGGGSYVAGLGNIYELEFGDLSGWMFRVNGEFSDVNAGEKVLSEGDFVEWLYTTDLGRDIGNEYQGDK